MRSAKFDDRPEDIRLVLSQDRSYSTFFFYRLLDKRNLKQNPNSLTKNVSDSFVPILYLPSGTDIARDLHWLQSSMWISVADPGCLSQIRIFSSRITDPEFASKN
jgi:hypothetical protein